MIVVILCGSPGWSSALRAASSGRRLDELFSDATGDAVDVIVVSTQDEQDPPAGAQTIVVSAVGRTGGLDGILARVRLTRVAEVMGRTPVGRLLNSLGPLSPARIFRRQLRRDKAANAVLSRADVIIAADVAATAAAWAAAHRDDATLAYLGVSAALSRLSRGTSGGGRR